MSLPALVTFGVDASVLQAYAAQVGMGSSTSALTTARVTTLVAGAAARVCGVLRRAGIDPETIDADTASSAYALARRATALLALPDALRSAQLGAAPAFAAMVAEAEAALQLLTADPASWGSGVDPLAPGVFTTSDALTDTDTFTSWRSGGTYHTRRGSGSART